MISLPNGHGHIMEPALTSYAFLNAGRSHGPEKKIARFL